MSRAERLPKLDFLRAFCAAVVVAYHYGFTAVPAGFGVLTFFVISGFLITSLLLKENGRTGTVSLKKFYIRRSLRIFPAFYVYWGIATVVLLVHNRSLILWGQSISSLFYVANYYQGLHGYPSSFFSHTWSLGIEEQFYLLWPAVFLACRHRIDALRRGLLIVIPCIWVYRGLLQHLGVSDAYLYTSFETRIDAILVGCLLAIVLYTGAAARFVAEARRSRYIPVVVAGLALSVCGMERVIRGYRYTFGYPVEATLIGILILQLISMDGWKWLDARPFSYLGQISYSAYLYQQMLIWVVRPRLPHAFSLIGCFVIVWVAAAISYELVEKRFLKLRKRFEVVKVPERSTGTGVLAA